MEWIDSLTPPQMYRLERYLNFGRLNVFLGLDTGFRYRFHEYQRIQLIHLSFHYKFFSSNHLSFISPTLSLFFVHSFSFHPVILLFRSHGDIFICWWQIKFFCFMLIFSYVFSFVSLSYFLYFHFHFHALHCQYDRFQCHWHFRHSTVQYSTIWRQQSLHIQDAL